MWVVDYILPGQTSIITSPTYYYRRSADQFAEYCWSRNWSAIVRPAVAHEIQAEQDLYERACA